MRKQLLTTATVTTISLTAVLGGLTTAASAESPVHEPDFEFHIPTVDTIPEPIPVPEFDPELPGSDDLIPPTIPEEPPFPPGGHDPFPLDPDLDLCLNLDLLCPPDLDDLLPPGGTVDPGDDEPGDDEPGEPGDPGDDEPGDDEPGDPGDDNPGDPGDDNPGEPGDDNPGEDDPEVPGDPVPTDIDEPVPGNPAFTG